MNFAAPLKILESAFGRKVALIAASLYPKVLKYSLSFVGAMKWFPVLRKLAIVVVTRLLNEASFQSEADFACSLRKLGPQRVIVSVATIEGWWHEAVRGVRLVLVVKVKLILT
jgi:hypothetical protein